MTPNTATGFEWLLATFDADPQEAGRLLQLQREKLVIFFDFKRTGIVDAERLADEVLDVALKHLQNGKNIQKIRAFLCQTAKYVWLNHHREMKRDQERFKEYERWVTTATRTSGLDERFELVSKECSQDCLQRLEPAERQLLQEYTTGNKKTRERLAQERHMARNSLTVRINRIRTNLRKCLAECVKSKCLN